MPFKLGPLELIIILAIIIVVFGVGKLPQVGGALGKGIHQFRKGISGGDSDDADAGGDMPAKSRNSSKGDA